MIFIATAAVAAFGLDEREKGYVTDLQKNYVSSRFFATPAINSTIIIDRSFLGYPLNFLRGDANRQ